MSTVLAALDDDASAAPVLLSAIRIGAVTEAGVEAVHVGDTSAASEFLERQAAQCHVQFRLLGGPVGEGLLGAVNAPGVITAVIGAQGSVGDRRPVGRTTMHLLERTNRPVAVIPPDLIVPDSFRRVLVPLDGSDMSSLPLLERVWPVLGVDVELVVLHVFSGRTMPPMLDCPEYDFEVLRREFRTRHCPQAVDVEFRQGPVAEQVAGVTREQGAELIILSWSQASGSDRAPFVREVLAASAVPVLLLPERRANWRNA